MFKSIVNLLPTAGMVIFAGFKDIVVGLACAGGMLTRVMLAMSSGIRDRHTVFFRVTYKHSLIFTEAKFSSTIYKLFLDIYFKELSIVSSFHEDAEMS